MLFVFTSSKIDLACLLVAIIDLSLPFSGFVLVPPLDLSGATPWICCGLVLADIYRHSDQGIVRPGDERFLWQSRNSG